MPYKSLAQAAYFNINKNKLEKEGVDVNEYNKESKGMKLPKKVKLKIKKKK
jgi:protein associated with RNAse G/E